MSHEIAALKAAARLAARHRRDAAQDPGAAARAALRLAAELGEADGHPVAAYLPIGTEIDPIAALAEHRICLPVVERRGHPLRFRLWEPGAPLAAGPFGTRHPEAGDWVRPHRLVVPLLAFDRRCMRLGYGGGFYDRTLAELRSHGPVTAIGFAFAGQESAHVPVEPTDARLDMIVTEAGTLR